MNHKDNVAKIKLVEKINPVCGLAPSWINRNPEFSLLIVIFWPGMKKIIGKFGGTQFGVFCIAKSIELSRRNASRTSDRNKGIGKFLTQCIRRRLQRLCTSSPPLISKR